MIFVVVGVLTAMIMARLDRLGKQMEAVSALIRSDLARTEIIGEWKGNKAQAAKDARQFWTFWGIVGAAALCCYLFSHR